MKVIIVFKMMKMLVEQFGEGDEEEKEEEEVEQGQGPFLITQGQGEDMEKENIEEVEEGDYHVSGEKRCFSDSGAGQRTREILS